MEFKRLRPRKRTKPVRMVVLLVLLILVILFWKYADAIIEKLF